MACTVEIDREGDAFKVSWQSGAQPVKAKTFPDRAAAEAFGEKKMGRTGMVISNLDMSPENMAAHLARKARAAVWLAEFGGDK